MSDTTTERPPAQRVTWVDHGRRVHGVITDRRAHVVHVLFDVRWDNGLLGTFIEGHEPDELHVAPLPSPRQNG